MAAEETTIQPLPGPAIVLVEDPIRQGRRCEDCAFYVKDDLRPHEEGECRVDPPAYTLDPELAGYRRLAPRTPACSLYLTPEEWRGLRRNFARAVAEMDDESAVSVPILNRP